MKKQATNLKMSKLNNWRKSVDYMQKSSAQSILLNESKTHTGISVSAGGCGDYDD